MTDIRQDAAMAKIRDALADVPEQYLGQVLQNLTHDIMVINAAIRFFFRIRLYRIKPHRSADCCHCWTGGFDCNKRR